jgi:hypothetical protein
MACFHIRWSDSELDWECHSTQADAERVAEQLAQIEEGYTIEKYQDGPGTLPCPFQHEGISVESALALLGARHHQRRIG